VVKHSQLGAEGQAYVLKLANKYTGRVHSVVIYTPPGVDSYKYIVYFYDRDDYLR